MSISRQAHYQWQRRRADDEAKFERVVDLVKEKRLRQPRLGTRKLHHLLRPTLAAEGLNLGRDAFSISCAGIACWYCPAGRITRRQTATIVSGAIPTC
jgi:hypothetical protein